MSEYNAKNYTEQGGERTVIGGSLDVASGGDLDIESGGAFKIAGTAVAASAAELNVLDAALAGATIVVGAETANVINVAIQLKDAAGADLAARAALPFYLADDANGDTPSSAAPDGGIAIGTDGAMIEWAANLSGLLISESDGDIDINLTHAAGAKTCYLILVMPNGSLIASSAITFA